MSSGFARTRCESDLDDISSSIECEAQVRDEKCFVSCPSRRDSRPRGVLISTSQLAGGLPHSVIARYGITISTIGSK